MGRGGNGGDGLSGKRLGLSVGDTQSTATAAKGDWDSGERALACNAKHCVWVIHAYSRDFLDVFYQL